jgi:hypothetical protein
MRRVLAHTLIPQKVVLAPGRISSMDSGAVFPWSRFNVGSVIDPRFARALRTSLRQMTK